MFRRGRRRQADTEAWGHKEEPTNLAMTTQSRTKSRHREPRKSPSLDPRFFLLSSVAVHKRSGPKLRPCFLIGNRVESSGAPFRRNGHGNTTLSRQTAPSTDNWPPRSRRRCRIFSTAPPCCGTPAVSSHPDLHRNSKPYSKSLLRTFQVLGWAIYIGRVPSGCSPVILPYHTHTHNGRHCSAPRPHLQEDRRYRRCLRGCLP